MKKRGKLKLIATLVAIVVGVGVALPVSVQAQTSDVKDNVLIYADKSGQARGYDLLWKVKSGGTFAQESAVTYKDGVAYLASTVADDYPGSDRNLTAIDVANGEIIDTYEIGSTFATPVIDDSTIYIGTGEESWRPDSGWSGSYGMYSIDISNIHTSGFSENWYQPITGGVAVPAAVGDSKIFFSQFLGNKIYALNKNDGSTAWEFSANSQYQAVPLLLQDDSIYALSSYQGSSTLYKINKNTGSKVFGKQTVGNAWDNTMAYDSESNAIFSAFYYGSKAIASYDMSGNLRWQATTTDRSLSFSAYENQTAFFSDLGGRVYARHASSGKEKWTAQIGNDGHNVTDIASPTIAGGLVFIGSKGANYPSDSEGRGGFYAVDEETGDIVWEYHEPGLGDVMAPASIADGIFFNKTNNYDTYAFDVGDGDQNWLYQRFDQNNTGSCESSGCLTTSRYVQADCSTTGATTTCDINNKYTRPAVETELKMEEETIASAVLPGGNYHIYTTSSSVFLPRIASQESMSGLQVRVGDSYRADLPQLSAVSPTSTHVRTANYNPETQNVSLSFDNTVSATATISSFQRPFTEASSTITALGTTTVTTSNLSGTKELTSVGMNLVPSSGSISVDIKEWKTTGREHRRWTEEAANANATATHTISALSPGETYQLRIDGEKETKHTADSAGQVTFVYSDGYSQHTFDLRRVPNTAASGHLLEPKDEANTATDTPDRKRSADRKLQKSSETNPATPVQVTELKRKLQLIRKKLHYLEKSLRTVTN